ncbi:hypothetical protein SD37_11110 [Amycolatopsis orientalis]|uniref:Uncharacterized protein n=1 Tax=Amycolatopsis orientalis TaxID=31958 RepID=A0A193BV77_AMYOR|nr:hypothetical protein [Amycolatopsis orientalis]ANN16131.1 hypothetical protein SD37_11110 [Amycolatopsis orientalis]
MSLQAGVPDSQSLLDMLAYRRQVRRLDGPQGGSEAPPLSRCLSGGESRLGLVLLLLGDVCFLMCLFLDFLRLGEPPPQGLDDVGPAGGRLGKAGDDGRAERGVDDAGDLVELGGPCPCGEFSEEIQRLVRGGREP